MQVLYGVYDTIFFRKRTLGNLVFVYK